MEGVPLGIGDGVGRRGRTLGIGRWKGIPRNRAWREQPQEWEVDRGPSGAGDGGGAPKSGGWTGEMGMELRQLGMGDRRDPPLGWGAEERNPQGWEMTGDPQE